MKLFSFELKKLLFSKKFLVMILLLIAGVIFLFLRNMSLQSYITNEERQSIEEKLEISYTNSALHKTKLEQDPNDKQEKKKRDINSTIIDTLYELRQASVTDDWKNKLTWQIKLLDNVNAYKNEGGMFPLTAKDINYQHALKQHLLEKNIPPEHQSYSIALPNFMKYATDLFIPIAAIILMMLLTGDILTSEYENNSIRLLFTQPLKRTHIITSKFATAFLTYLCICLIFVISTFAIGTFFGEKGTFDYPIIMEINDSIHFISIFEYISRSFIVMSVLILFIISLQLLFSILFKHTILSLFVSAMTLIAGYGITVFVTWDLSGWVNPFQYLMTKETLVIQHTASWYQSIPITLVVSIILFVITIQHVKRSKVE